MSTVMAPLYKLLQNSQPWIWKEAQKQAFEKSKNAPSLFKSFSPLQH